MARSFRGGSLLIQSSGLYIYFIVVHDLLYIGITTKNPVKRWSEHLSSQGTLTCKLRCYDDSLSFDSADILLISFECTQIFEEFPLIQCELVLRFIENEIHNVCFCSSSKLPKKFTIISDTTRTAPRQFKSAWAEQYALHIFEMFVDKISGYYVSQ